MKIKSKKLNLGKVYFWYLFFALFLQIVGLEGQSDTLELLWKAVVIILTMLYVFYKKSWMMAKYLFWPLVIYMVGQFGAFAFFPRATYSMFINCGIVVCMTYMFMSLTFNNKTFELEDMVWFVKAFIALMLYAVAYQLVTNPTSIFGSLSNRNVYSNMLSGFFDNKQTFGMFLFVAIIACCCGFVLSRKKAYIVLAMVFFAVLFICSSRISLIACLTFVLMLVVLFFRTNRSMAVSVLLLVLLFVAAVAIITPLRHFVLDVLMDTEATVDARTRIWDASFQAMHGEKILFGYGEGNVALAIWGINYRLIGNSHNGLIHVLLTGGLIKFGLYICVAANSIRCALRIRKHNAALANVFLAALTGVIAFSMGESLVLLDTSTPCIVASVMCVAFPMAVDGYYRRQPVVSKDAPAEDPDGRS